MPNTLNLPLPHGDFVALVDSNIERLEVQISELRATLRGYFAGAAHASENHEQHRASEAE